jgi:hypothetical protein
MAVRKALRVARIPASAGMTELKAAKTLRRPFQVQKTRTGIEKGQEVSSLTPLPPGWIR